MLSIATLVIMISIFSSPTYFFIHSTETMITYSTNSIGDSSKLARLVDIYGRITLILKL